MKRLIRNYNYALSTSNFPLWSSSKDQRWNENRDVQDSFITLLATGGSEMPPLFSPPRVAEWFFLGVKLVPFFPSITANPPALVQGICKHTHTPTHTSSAGDCSGGSIFSHVDLHPHLPPRPHISTNSSVSASPASIPKPELHSHPVHSTKLLPSPDNKKNVDFFFFNFHRKLFWIHPFMTKLYPSEISDLCTSQMEPWGLVSTPRPAFTLSLKHTRIVFASFSSGDFQDSATEKHPLSNPGD